MESIEFINYYDCIVIGAGFAGALSALKLSKKFKVLLIEKENEIIPNQCSSMNECFKIHNGFHFHSHLPTAKMTLEKSIEFAKEFGDLFDGGLDIQSKFRKSNAYVMSNSPVDKDESLKLSEILREHYKAIVAIDPANRVFGDPDHFVRVLEPHENTHISDSIPFKQENGEIVPIKMTVGFETMESQISVDRFKNYISKKLLSNSNITFLANTIVKKISVLENDSVGYSVKTNNVNNNQQQFYYGHSIVNCSWNDIERLDRSASLLSDQIDDNIVNRIKLSLFIQVPDSFKFMKTTTFISGPYSHMSVFEDGTAILVGQVSCNVGYFNSKQDDQSKRFRSKYSLDSDEGKKLAQEILNECAGYYREDLKQDLLNSKILELRVGLVKVNQDNYEYSSIYKSDGGFHTRTFDGIERRRIGEKIEPNTKGGLALNDFIEKLLQQYSIEEVKKYLEKQSIFHDAIKKYILTTREDSPLHLLEYVPQIFMITTLNISIWEGNVDSFSKLLSNYLPMMINIDTLWFNFEFDDLDLSPVAHQIRIPSGSIKQPIKEFHIIFNTDYNDEYGYRISPIDVLENIIQVGSIPSSCEFLEVSHFLVEHNPLQLIPPSVKKLHVISWYSDVTNTSIMVPSTVQKLKLKSPLDFGTNLIPKGILPQSITHLDMVGGIIMEYPKIPSSVKKFKCILKQGMPIEPGFIPSNVERFEVSCEEEIMPGVIPNGVKEFIAKVACNEPFKKGFIPESDTNSNSFLPTKTMSSPKKSVTLFYQLD
eukprot:gene1989-2449_t